VNQHSGSSFDQTVAHSLSTANGTLAANAASNSSSLTASAANTASQGSSVLTASDNTQTSSSGTQVFNNLQTFNSNQFTLIVNLTADQVNNVMQVFQGNNGVVTGSGNFPIVLPSCIIN
jgi:hypothetical protein